MDSEGLADCLEAKLAAVAVHWRGFTASQVLTTRTKAYRTPEPLATRPDLVLAEFEEGIEIRLRSANKGNVLRTLLSELDGNVPIAYLGDDSTDEDAFRALNGRGLTVLVRPKLHYFYRAFSRPELVAFYRAAHIAAVTPLRDGMNLVAKEFCAFRIDKRGVLVLSEFAGAAEELKCGALLVNPHDAEAVASAFKAALRMDESEQRARMETMQSHLRIHDVFRWSESFNADSSPGIDISFETAYRSVQPIAAGTHP